MLGLVLAAVVSVQAPSAPERIVFSSDRAAAVLRPAFFSTRSDGSERRRISPLLPIISDPVWTPDGKRLAFVARQDLYVVTTATRRVRRLTRGDLVSRPAWSPDGRRLAYVSYRRREVRVVSSGGGAPRVVARALGRDIDGGVAWSPDGTRLAIPRARQLGQDIVILDLRTGRQTRLPPSPQYDLDPAWSPDGRQVAFTYNFDAAHDDSVVVVDLEHPARRVVARYGHGASWSPDSKKIAYSYDRTLSVVSSTGTSRRALAQLDNLRNQDPLSPVFGQWSPDSRELAAVIKGEVWAVRADGRGRRRITHERPRSEIVEYPAWSGNGRIVFASKRHDPGDRDIYSIAPDGSNLRPLTANAQDEDDPVLSPDGELVAFVRHRTASVLPDLVVKRLDRPGERVVAEGATNPAWAPTGQLTFARSGAIHSLDLQTGAHRLLLPAPADWGLAWSPEGKRLAYSPPTTQYGSSLLVLNLADNSSQSIANFGCNRAPDWSPDGAAIAFTVAQDCAAEDESVYIVAPDGSGLHRFGPEAEATESDASWSPDGTRLVLARALYDDDDQRVSRLVVARRDGTQLRVVFRGPGSAWNPDWGLLSS